MIDLFPSQLNVDSEAEASRINCGCGCGDMYGPGSPQNIEYRNGFRVGVDATFNPKLKD